MTLTLQDCDAHIRHTLRKAQDVVIPTPMLVRQTGNWISGLADWQFLIRPAVHLNKRGLITITGGTWTEATKTLTKASAFTSYVFLDGDQIHVTGGTGATIGFYTVASRTSANAIVLETSIGSAANGQTDIAATLELPSVKLPDDFAEIMALKPSESMVGTLNPITYEELIDLRAVQTTRTSPSEFYAITLYGNPPVNRLEIFPTPTSDVSNAYMLIYRAAWTFPADDDDDGETVPIEDTMEPLFLRALRAFARGYQEEDAASMSVRLAEIVGGVEWLSAVQADSSRRPSLGRLSGGAASKYLGQPKRWHRNDQVVSWP